MTGNSLALSASNRCLANISASMLNPQCLHIVLACRHEGIFSGTLSEIAAVESMTSRITLVEHRSFLSETRSLAFKVARFDEIFYY